MKIALLHMTLGLALRGSEDYVDLVATALSHKNQVLVLQSGPTYDSPYEAQRVYPLEEAPQPAPTSFLQKILYFLKIDHRSAESLSFTLSCIPVLKKFEPDIIFATNGGDQVKALKKYLPSAKIVVVGHAGIGHDDMNNLAARPDLFIALTQPAHTWAQKNKHSHTRISYIPNPIDIKRFSNTKPAYLDLPRPVVLTVAAFSAYKNILSVVQALKPLNVSLLLIGDGEERDKVQQELSTFPGDFRWISSLDPTEMPAYYRAADAFCFVPDPQEAFGRVYLEAMASGLPIVASDDPIRRSIIGEHGIYVDPHDLDDIRGKIVLAVNEKKINYATKLNEYKLDDVIKKIQKELNELTS